MTQFTSLVWLASYPKSGNTWIRVILGALLADSKGDSGIDINSLSLNDHAGSRSIVESVAACPSSELCPDEVDRLRPAGFRFLAQSRDGLVFVKVHDRYRLLDPSTPLFPTEVSRQVIYIIRNPLDVAVSFAAHLGASIDDTISWMSGNFVMGGGHSHPGPQVRQQLGSWSDHVASWTSQHVVPVQVVRYEDLSANVEVELAGLARLLGLPGSDVEVAAAAEAGNFNRLQSFELQSGFREKPASLNGLFFRAGRAGGWRHALSGRQVARVTRHHTLMMHRFGYLSDT